MAVYSEYWFWYVPPDVITFVWELDMRMYFVLSSRANLLAVLKLLEVTKSPRFDFLSDSWCDRTQRFIDHHQVVPAVGEI